MGVGIRARTADRPNSKHGGRVIAGIGARLLAVAIGVIGLMWILGSLVVHGLLPSVVGRVDEQTSEWAVEHRTPNLDSVTQASSMAADTLVALAVTVVAVLGLRAWLGRWRESLVTVVAIVGELLIFLVITAIVHRDRPAVPQLDQAPPHRVFPPATPEQRSCSTGVLL